jgi:hypothetical protein
LKHIQSMWLIFVLFQRSGHLRDHYRWLILVNWGWCLGLWLNLWGLRLWLDRASLRGCLWLLLGKRGTLQNDRIDWLGLRKGRALQVARVSGLHLRLIRNLAWGPRVGRGLSDDRIRILRARVRWLLLDFTICWCRRLKISQIRNCAR